MRAVHEGRAATDETFTRVHGPLPRVPRVRGRLPVARAVRADDGGGADADRTAPFAAREVPPLARPRRRAPVADADLARGRARSARAPVPPGARPGADPHGAASRSHGSPASPSRRASLRGTVALLSGCVQDRWFRRVNLATIRVLARNGWRVVVPREQTCCGALAAHNGHLGTARKLARKNAAAFARRGSRRRERRRMRRAHAVLRRPGRGRRSSRARRDGVPARRGPRERRGLAPRAHPRRLPRRVSRAPGAGHPRPAARAASARSATSSSSRSRTATAAAAPPGSTTSPSRRCPAG